MDLSKYANERHPFLKPENVGAKKTFKVIALKEAPRGMRFSDLLLEVADGSKHFTVGVTFDSVMLSQLVSELGPNTDKWPGKKVTFVTATYIPKKGKNKGKKTKIVNVG